MAGLGSWLRGPCPRRTSSWLVCRLPERPLIALAELGGDLWYRADAGSRGAGAAQPGPRRGLASTARVGHAGGPGGRHATRARSSGWSGSPTDMPRATTSRCARTPALRPRRSDAADPHRDGRSAVDDAFRSGQAGHLRRPPFRGDRAARPVPGDSRRRARSRRWRRSPTRRCRTGSCGPAGAAGLRIVGLREARRELTSALRGGESVGLVGDRDLTGGGMLTELFGAPAHAAARPGHARRRDGRARVRRGGPPRVGRAATSAGSSPSRCPTTAPAASAPTATMAAIAGPSSASSRTRPSSGGRCSSRSGRTSRGRQRPSQPIAGRAAAPTCTSTPSPRTGSPTSVAILERVAAAGELDVIAITDHERIDAAVAGAAIARDRGLRARGHRRRGGHDPRRAPAGAVHRSADPAVPLAADDDRRRPRRGRPGHPGPPARAVSAVRPGLGPAAPPGRSGRGRPTRTPSRRSTRRRSAGRGTIVSCASPTTTASPVSATATPTPSTPSGPAGRRSRARPRPTCAGHRRADRPSTAARSTAPRPARHVRPAARASAAATPATRSPAASGGRHRARPRLPGGAPGRRATSPTSRPTRRAA